jgi:ectoine hydroxylase
MLTRDQVMQFHRDGYLIVPSFLDAEETELLRTAARADERMQKNAMRVADTQGRATNLPLWNHPGNDIYGAIARSHRVVDAMEQLLGGEVYHYHSKLSAKQPKVGGAWEWHQDYGYWYDNGCLLPDLATVMISIDRATRENGCLKMLRGSHRLGRIEHGRFGEQTGADPERVNVALSRMDLVYFESEPGTALFFHSNLLHASDPNVSDQPRWALLCCYNTAENNPYKESHHPRYTPLQKVPDTAIKQMGATPSELTQVFLRQEEDATTG